ncbi:MAG: methyl-accepting chemotaxis protein [Enterobacterales bacterium]|jgi:methyl-accepting chemotaxis protein
MECSSNKNNYNHIRVILTMKLTVTARISGGFGVIVLFLIIIGITGFSSINTISGNLSKVVDEMSPMALLSGELKSTLLEVNQNLNAYNNSRDATALPQIEANISAIRADYLKAFSSLEEIARSYSSTTAPLSSLSAISSTYFSNIENIYSEHSRELQLIESLDDKRGTLEDLADELDTLVIDFSDDTSKKNLKAVLVSIASLVGDAVITSIDALVENNISGLAISIREMDATVASLKVKAAEVSGLKSGSTENDYYINMMSLLNSYNSYISGSDSLLTMHQSRLEAAEKSNTQMTTSNENVSEFLKHSVDLISAITLASNETKASAESNVSFSRMIIIVSSLLSILAAIGIAVWVIQTIRKPLANVNSMLQVIAKGDLTQHIEIENNDEFGELSGWVNDLVDNLRNIIFDIKTNTHSLSIAAEQTSVVTNQTSSNINQQRIQTNHILESMEQMSSAVEEVAQSANSTATEVEKAHSETTAGSSIVSSNIQSIKDLAGEIDTAAEVINKLDEYSTSIGNVLDVIRGIAEQTNLLALNAAIEAARAGEQGRGFAVVADEVRTLASRTQESTSEIQVMIERLQSGANEAVQVMKSSKDKAAMSVDDIQKAGELLATITEGITIINDMSTHIATAAEEQASVTEEVHKNVNAIAGIADQTAVGAEKTMDSSVEVAALSEKLKDSVGHFKI